MAECGAVSEKCEAIVRPEKKKNNKDSTEIRKTKNLLIIIIIIIKDSNKRFRFGIF